MRFALVLGITVLILGFLVQPLFQAADNMEPKRIEPRFRGTSSPEWVRVSPTKEQKAARRAIKRTLRPANPYVGN